MFQRLNRADGYEGTGIGLAIMRRRSNEWGVTSVSNLNGGKAAASR
ncbi:MAG TPA: hypothetical protein VLT36_02325 [Candidatus Dormibacteraeota bacterium]|nr:hypothetical protein [Candidatus Dormibacteraeota bacterium]